MALPLFKTQGKEMTATATVAKPPIVASKLQRLAQNDPIAARIEQDEMNGSPTIDNTGRGALRMRNIAFEINKVYASANEKDEIYREENGEKSHFEAVIEQGYIFAEIYNSTHPSHLSSTPSVAAGYSVGESYKGSNGITYTNIYGEDGKLAYVDNGTMCMFPKAGLGSAAETAQNDPQFDDSQKYNIKYKTVFDKDGNAHTVERTPEDASFQATMATIDNKYTKFQTVDEIIKDVTSKPAQTDPSFGSSVASGITTSVAPTKTFLTAAAGTEAPAPQKSVVFRPDAPTLPPWAKPAEPAPAPAPAP